MAFKSPCLYADSIDTPRVVNFRCEHYTGNTLDGGEPESLWHKMLPTYRTNTYGFGTGSIKVINIPCWECPDCTSQDVTFQVRKILDDIRNIRHRTCARTIDFSALFGTRPGME